MPVKFSPPGSKRFRGRMRAQMQKVVSVGNALIHYSDQLAARTPPIQFLDPTQRQDMVTAVLTCETLLSTVN